MAKKQKFATEQNAPATDTPVQETAEASIPKAPKQPRAPAAVLFLRNDQGVEFKIDIRPKLPKKSPALSLYINGEKQSGYQTSSKGFAAPGHTLYYTWFELPSNDPSQTDQPRFGYITSDYEQPFLPDQQYTIQSGVPNRKNPQRVPKDDAVGAARIAKFQATYAANKAAGKYTKPTEAPTTGDAEGTLGAPAEEQSAA